MTPLGWIMIGTSIFVGAILGYFLFKYFPNLLERDKKIKEVINNPHLLVEKLKSSGKIYDGGKELDIKVGVDNETGNEVVVVEEKESKKAMAIQKKVKGHDKKIKKQIMAKKKKNPWLDHVKKEKAKSGNKGKSLKEILKIASKSYKKK